MGVNPSDIPKPIGRLEVIMKRMIGFILFWIAIGMTIMLFITNGLLAICIIILCLLLGYNLFCN